MKKTLLTTIVLFFVLLSNAQQVSELSKNLIFRWTGNEWDGNRDMVSNSQGVSTATYPVLSKDGSGRRWLEYNGSSSYTTLPGTIPAFGTSDFTVIMKFTTPISGTFALCGGGTDNIFSLVTNNDNKINIYSTNAAYIGTSDATINIGALNTVLYTRVYGTTTGSITINGVSKTVTDNTNYSSTITALGIYVNSSFFSGSISMCRIFNYALTPDDIAYYSRPENPIKAVDRGATGAVLTSGTITTGKKYLIKTFVASDVFTNVGAASNATGVIFTATGTTPTTWTNASSLVQIGNVLDLNAEGLAQSTSGYWYDRTNSTAASGYTSVAATNSSTTLVIPPASNLRAMSFNGTTSNIAFTGMNGLTGDITISIWFNSLITTPPGILFSNSKIYCIVQTNGRISFSRSTVIDKYSAAGAYSGNQWCNVIITSNNLGYTTFYVNGVLSGAINQTTETPVASTSYLIGSLASTFYFNGLIGSSNIWSRILSLDEAKLIYDTEF